MDSLDDYPRSAPAKNLPISTSARCLESGTARIYAGQVGATRINEPDSDRKLDTVS
jgi:hypothetical protein